MASPSKPESVFTVEYLGRVAVLTIHNEKRLNALSQKQYHELSQNLREIAKHDEVFVTVILGKGRFFSAGADFTSSGKGPGAGEDLRGYWLKNFVAFNLSNAEAFASHPKILVVGLNGPVVGLSAALASHADFIYCAPHTFLLTPFSSLGLVAEGGASRALVTRLGLAKANEALIMSKKITAPELERCGFVNAIFDVAQGEDAKFRDLLLSEVDERLGEHLIGGSLLGIKKLIRGPERNIVDLGSVHEAFEGLEQWLKGIPQEEFRKIASGEKRHKL